MQQVGAEEGGVAEVSLAGKGSFAGKSTGELPYFLRDGVQLLA
jgi:hypothetical protein